MSELLIEPAVNIGTFSATLARSGTQTAHFAGLARDVMVKGTGLSRPCSSTSAPRDSGRRCVDVRGSVSA